MHFQAYLDGRPKGLHYVQAKAGRYAVVVRSFTTSSKGIMLMAS